MASPQADRIISHIESNLILFHKNQKTGFYTFEPFAGDYLRALGDFGDSICARYTKNGISVKVGHCFAYMDQQNHHIMESLILSFNISHNHTMYSVKYKIYPNLINHVIEMFSPISTSGVESEFLLYASDD
jgi:hypothetical protein